MLDFRNGLYSIDGRKVEKVDLPFLNVYDEKTNEEKIYYFKKSRFTLEFLTIFFNKYISIREKISNLENKEEINIVEIEKEMRELLKESSDIKKEIADTISAFDLWAILNDFLGMINDDNYLKRKNLIIIMNKLKEKITEEEKQEIFSIMKQEKEILYKILDFDILEKENYDKAFETNLKDTAMQLYSEYKKKIQK